MGFGWGGSRREYEDDFVAYYAARGEALRRAAYLLGGDWHLAEDLTQTTFTKLYRSWQRIQRWCCGLDAAGLVMRVGAVRH